MDIGYCYNLLCDIYILNPFPFGTSPYSYTTKGLREPAKKMGIAFVSLSYSYKCVANK